MTIIDGVEIERIGRTYFDGVTVHLTGWLFGDCLDSVKDKPFTQWIGENINNLIYLTVERDHFLESWCGGKGSKRGNS